MTLFQYKAINKNGKKTHGILDANHMQEVQKKLFADQLIVTDISIPKKKKISKHLTKKEVLNFTRELSKLLLASLPLYDSLLALEEKYRASKIHPIIIDLCDQIKKGISFSKGLEKYPQVFDPLFRSIVSNSEKTGSLAKALDQISVLMSKQISIKTKLINTLIYPSILLSFCLVVLISLFFYVIPTLSDLFEDRSVHFYTRLILNFSAFLNAHIKLFFLGLISLISFFVLCYFIKSMKILFYQILSKSFFVGKIVQKSALIRYCRSLSSLLFGGVSFIHALQLSRKVMNHPVLESIFEKIEKNVIEGKSFAEQLQNVKVIPPLMSRMIAIAEKSGKMSHMLQQIADIEEEDLAKKLTFLTNVAQPIILLILGCIVGLVLLAVLLPLTDVSSFMSY